MSNAEYYSLYISKPPYGPSNLVFNSREDYGKIDGTSFTLPSGILKNSVTYRWNMRAYSSEGWSNYSKVLYFKTATELPPDVTLPPPTLVSPLNNSNVATDTPIFRWDQVSNAEYYSLYISKPPYGPSNLVFNSREDYGKIDGTSFTLPSGILKNSVTYRWNMRAYSSEGWSSYSKVLYFKKSEELPPAAEKPAVITNVTLLVEPQVTKVSIISDKQLNFKQVVSGKKPPSVDVESVLELDFVNATSDLSTEIPDQPKGVIRKVMLDTEIGPPPSCKITIQLTKRVFYDINNIDGELQVSFENPILDRIVTIKSDNENLSLLLFTLFKQYNANIIVAKDVDVSQKVTFNLENVPLKVALDEILGSLGYKYEEVSGGILRIVTIPQPPEIPEEDVKKLETKSFPLKYPPVPELKEELQSLISADGKIIELPKSIIIMDTPENFAILGNTLDKIVSELDQKVPEEKKEQPVLPEKKLIKLNYASPEELKNILTPLLSQDGKIEPFGKSSGTDGGGGAGTVGQSAGTGGAGEAGLGASVGHGGYLIVTDTLEVISQIEREIAKLDVPIPQVEIQAYIIESTLSNEIESGVDWARIQAKETEISADALSTEGTLRLSYGTLPAEKFTAVLTALSTQSDTNLLSSPRITVLDNNQATFHSGDQIGFSRITTNIQEGTRTEEIYFEDVGIQLEVSLQIKPNDIISLLVNVQVRDLGEVTPTGEPTISDRSAQTQLLVRDSDTAVIGGLTSDRIIESVRRVPLLGNIPILGRLFSHKKNTKKKTEMTLFITPRIVKTEAGN
ncbi:type II secretion system protein GspD [bacterium]|nr:type II secretion system protein GspD [bacterium]